LAGEARKRVLAVRIARLILRPPFVINYCTGPVSLMSAAARKKARVEGKKVPLQTVENVDLDQVLENVMLNYNVYVRKFLLYLNAHSEGVVNGQAHGRVHLRAGGPGRPRAALPEGGIRIFGHRARALRPARDLHQPPPISCVQEGHQGKFAFV
jgi:hypothetical protein